MVEVRIGSYTCNCTRMNRVFVSCERQPARYTITVPEDFSRNAGPQVAADPAVNASRELTREI